MRIRRSCTSRQRAGGLMSKTDEPMSGIDRAVATPAPDEDARPAVLRFLEQITEELADGPLNLPCFPDVVPRIRQSMADPDSTPEDVVRAAGTEPRLAARLLQTANSAVFNPAGKPITNLRVAVTRLGHHLVQSVTMAFAVQQLKAEPTLRPVAETLSQLWEKSIAVASICQVLARQLRVPPDKVFLTGLLHGIGHFYIMVRAASGPREMLTSRVLQDFVVDWHPAIGQSVLEQWGFESVMCEAVGSQREYDRKGRRPADLTDVVIASVALAEALLERDGDLGEYGQITAFANLGLTEQELRATLVHTQHVLGSLRDTLGC